MGAGYKLILICFLLHYLFKDWIQYMSERDRSLLMPQSQLNVSGVLSQLSSKQMVQSHISEIMSNYKGGKNQMQYVVIFVPKDLHNSRDLQRILKNQLIESFGEFLNYKIVKDKRDILDQNLKDNVLYYIIADEKLYPWAQKFSRQQRQESNGKKYIGVIRMLKNKKFKQLQTEKAKLFEKNKLAAQTLAYHTFDIDMDERDLNPQVQQLIGFIEQKLTVNIDKEKKKAKNWAISNKYKAKKKQKQRLYLYVQKDPRENIIDAIQQISKISAKKGNYKWVQIVPFQSYRDIIQHIQKRHEEINMQYDVASQASKIFTSRILDKSQSRIGAVSSRLFNPSPTSRMIGSSLRSKSPSPSTITSQKHLPIDRIQQNIPQNNKNYIICSKDFDEIKKVYHFVMAQKQDNWKLIEYQDEQIADIKKQIRNLILENRKKEDEMLESEIVSAKTLYLFVPLEDAYAQNIYRDSKNYCRNSEMMLYQSSEQLRDKLNQYSRNMDNYTVVLLKYANTEQHSQVMDFIDKNCQWTDQRNKQLSNLTYKFTSGNNYNSVTSYLSMNSIYNQGNQSVYEWLHAVLEDRDRYFHPLQGLQGRNIYILVKDTKQHQILDHKMHEYIQKSPRLLKTTYTDQSYLKKFITNTQRKKDSIIILTNDSTLREAQFVAKQFDEVVIMNITDRNMGEEVKVIAWGPKETIYQFIYEIKQRKEKLRRKNYEQQPPFLSYERANRILPKKIDFNGGKTITVRIPSNEIDQNSVTMENNLDHYFNEQIRFQFYKNPKEIRLINKKEQPLSFVICRDDKEDLEYMKKISREEKDELRSEYILYSQNPHSHQYLVTDKKHQRFRFISNSWERIQNYIIGVYQSINGYDNDSIYDDQLIHVFYYPEDQNIIYYLQQLLETKKIKKNVRLHRLQKNRQEAVMQQVLALESPHHLYFMIVNEKQGVTSIDNAKNLIDVANKSYMGFPKQLKYKVPPKKVNIIQIKNNSLTGKDPRVKAVFESGQQAAKYIAQTKQKPYISQNNKPYILINNSTQDWYYFLQKYKMFPRYNFEHFTNEGELLETMKRIREKDVGSKIWIIVNNQKQLKQYQRAIKKIENGRQINFIFHGDGWQSRDKVLLSDGNRQQIESFILNHFKRSNRYFSPQMLLAYNPRICMSQETSSRVMISEDQKKKWAEDLNAEFITYSGAPPEELKNSSRPVFMIQDINQERLKGYNHVRRIVFDSNENNRQKNHDVSQVYQNKRDMYVGYYPAEINEYLKFLRFNIKNPPSKINRYFPSQLTRVYKQDFIELNPQFQKILYEKNDSIVDIISFSDLNQAIRDSKKYPAYNSLFLVGRGYADKLRHSSEQLNYICFDQKHRTNPINSGGLLETEDKDQYSMYLFNLPEKRYDNARKLKKELDVYYLNNSPVTPFAKNISTINSRNKAFTLNSYGKINDLKNINKNITVLVTNQMLRNHKEQLKLQKNISYFIIDEDRLRNLEPDKNKSEYFITKTALQPSYYFENARIVSGSERIPQEKPIINIPQIMKKNFKMSRPLQIKHLDPNRKFHLYPPFQLKDGKNVLPPVPPIPPSPPQPVIQPYNYVNFIDISKAQMFKLSPAFREDQATPRVQMPTIHVDPQPKAPEPISIKLDYAPAIVDHNFDSVPDNDNILPIMNKPEPKKLDKTLAVLYPENKEFIEIIRVLRENLHPKSFLITQFPYKSEYDLQNYFKNYLQKFQSGYDKTLFFFTPKYYKYHQQLKAVKHRMGHRLQYHLFEDNFNLQYDAFKRFLSPYTMAQYSLPYINRQDPQFWLSTNTYNVLVPLNMKKKYDILKSQNVRVLIYKPNDLDQIANQLHCQSQFVIIICNKQNFHKLKHFPRMSPRCILVIQDAESVNVDEIPLFRYNKKVLYQGPDALNYLQKYRIPNRKLPIKQETLKTIFFNPNIPGEYQQAITENYDSYEKIPYINNQDLFVKLIERFRLSHNFKLPNSRAIKTPIKLIPKLYMNKNAAYQLSYKNQYSAIQSRSQFKPSFKTQIKPSQYAHLPIKDYQNWKDLAADLQKQECPCIVYVDINVRQYQKIIRDMQHKHLFIMMFDFRDRWIQKNGDLTATHLLARPEELTIKQVLFTSMFNQQVFDTYNDMGYFYLSNKADIDKKRNITFMTKQRLIQTYKSNPNLLMIIFVESTDKQHIPPQFYEPTMDRSQDDRVKLIFLHHSFVNNDHTLYIKFNEIDPVINHINRVEISGRVDYCLYPSGELGNLVWHKFSQQNRGYESLAYNTVEQIDRIAQDIKGKFRNVMVICDREDHGSIQTILHEYSIKTKPNSNEKVTFEFIPEFQKQSYAKASAIKKSSMLHFEDNQEDNLEKFETVGHGIDIKLNSGYNTKIEDVIESKNFVLSVNNKLRDVFPVGNFYASKVKYFKDLGKLSQIESGKTQLLISNQNYPQIQKLIAKNPQIFVVYVSNEMPAGQNGNTLVIKQQQIPSLISKLQGTVQENGQNQMLNHQSELSIKNLSEYKIVRIVYDKNIDKETKRKIFNASMSIKGKNIVPILYKDVETLKEMVKEEESLVLLMLSEEPPELAPSLDKQDYIIVHKKKTKMILPKKFDSAIDGLSTILQEHESQLQYLKQNNLTESNLNLYLHMIEINPQKNKKALKPAYQSHDEEQQKQSNKGLDNDHENITKLRVHSVIRQQNMLDEEEIYKIRQRLDGGVIVVVVEKKYTESTKQILNKYNILIQQYSHAINLSQSIRDRKDKVTIVVIQKNMLESIMPIKRQFPRLVFILLNQSHEAIPKEYQPFISGQINKINDIEAIINDIYEQNEKIKYSDQIKSPSRFDNRKTSTVDVANSEKFSVGFNNTRAKKAFVFFKEPQNSMIISKLSEYLNNITFVPYKEPLDLQKKVNAYQGYQSILIANGPDILELQDYVSKKKDQIYVIRYNPARDLKENPKIKLLLSTTSEQDISNYLLTEFHRNSLPSQRTITSRMNLQKNIPETKKYVQKYEPNTFGTTPRFPQDFVPPKSKESTYSKRYLKSGSKSSKIIGRDMRSLDPRSIEGSSYYH